MIRSVKASAAFLVFSFAACTPACTPASRSAWDQHDTPFALFVFLRTDCPISGRYAPELERLQSAWMNKGVRFELVYPDPRDDDRAIEDHAKAFGLSGHHVRDPDHFLVQKVGATVTPEVALVDRTGELFYRGRIDDRFPSIQGTQKGVERRDLEDALTRALVQGTRSGTTAAVGCAIRGAD